MRTQTSLRLLAFALCVFVPLYAQEKKESPGGGDAQGPTNLKVLKASTRSEVRQIMRTFTTGLGVQCTYCHSSDDFASDDNPMKEKTRRMIKMTQKINGEFPDAKMHVSCYTCHRGETDPKTAPGQ